MDVLLSTYNDRILNIDKLIESINLLDHRLIIAHQVDKDINVQVSDYIKKIIGLKNISYYCLNSKGVTKSRNFLLTKVTSDFFTFCDDDVFYRKNALSIIESKMIEQDIDIATCKIFTDGNKDFKKYRASSFIHNKISILRVGTIEIVARRSKVVGKVLFPEFMGAGTSLPLCDEPVFLSRCMDIKLSITYVPVELCYHPPISSGTLISNSSTKARGRCFRELFGVIGLFILIPFVIKMRLKNNKINSMYFLYFLIVGFMRK